MPNLKDLNLDLHSWLSQVCHAQSILLLHCVKDLKTFEVSVQESVPWSSQDGVLFTLVPSLPLEQVWHIVFLGSMISLRNSYYIEQCMR